MKQLNHLVNTINEINSKYTADALSLNANYASILSQILLLTERNFLHTVREVNEYWLRLSIFVFFSIFCGIMFYDIQSTVNTAHNKIAFNGYVVNFISVSSAACIYSRQKKILYVRERLNNYYTPFSHCVSEILCEIPWNAANILMLSVTSILTVNSRPDCVWEYFIQFYLICFVLIFTTNSWAIFISSLSSKYITIFSLYACTISIFAMFS
eukprot:278651_1